MPKKLLSREEEKALFLSYKEGNVRARDKIVESNLSLVWSQVQKYKNKKLGTTTTEDLYSYGCLGLLKAIEKFKLDKGKFSTYAVYWIKREIIHNMTKEGFLITIPEDKLMKISKSIKEFGIDKCPEDIVMLTYLNRQFEFRDESTKNKNRKEKNINSFFKMKLLELGVFTSFDGYQSTLIDEKKREKIIKDVLNSLNSNEKFVLKSLYGINSKKLTIKKIMEISDFSNDTIKNIKEQAFRKIKRNSDSEVLKELLYF